jgi:hypothetical protein
LRDYSVFLYKTTGRMHRVFQNKVAAMSFVSVAILQYLKLKVEDIEDTAGTSVVCKLQI